ncbi:MAG: DMP19 family protein [Verrucomicrobiota bacterium]
MSDPKTKGRFDRLRERMALHGLESLTLSERASFGMTCLFLETNNGGLDQFFFNSAGAFASDALRGLEMIGATATASILRRAMVVFPDSIVPIETVQRRAFLCDALSTEHAKLLSDLTKEFYKSPEAVADLFNAYVAQHPEEFPT